MKRDKCPNYYSTTATPSTIGGIVVNNSDTDKNLLYGELAVLLTANNEGLYTLNKNGNGLIEYKPYSFISSNAISAEKINISFKGVNTILNGATATLVYTDISGKKITKIFPYDLAITHYTYNIPKGVIYSVTGKDVNGQTINTFNNITAKEYANRQIVIEYLKNPTAIYNTTTTNQNILITQKKEYFSNIIINGVNQPLTGTGTLSYTFPTVGSHQVEFKWKDGIESIYMAFLNCTNLLSVSDDIFYSLTGVTDFSGIFQGCGNLISIPVNLFTNCYTATKFDGVFSGCLNLSGNIPTNLFNNCWNAISFNNTFSGCSGLTGSLPIGLFDNCTKVTSFIGTFGGCLNLSGNIPTNLFNNCVNVVSFANTFQSCKNLASIPNSLFDNCKNVTFFSNTFMECTNLVGNTPKTGLLELWQRAGQPGYPTTINGVGCFNNCSKLSNFSSVSTGWK